MFSSALATTPSCENCKNRLFRGGKKIKCPGVLCGPQRGQVCGKLLSKNDVSAETKEDRDFEREVSVRKAHEDLVLIRGEFPSLQAYNDHLEWVENIVYELVHGSEPAQQTATQVVKKFRSDNVQRIQTSVSKNRESLRKVAKKVKMEEDRYAAKREEAEAEDAAMQEIRRKAGEANNGFLLGEMDVEELKKVQEQRRVMDRHKQGQRAAAEEQDRLRDAGVHQGSAAEVPTGGGQPAMMLPPMVIQAPQPMMDDRDRVDQRHVGFMGGVNVVGPEVIAARRRAGGYSTDTVRRRAIHESMDLLFFGNLI